MTSFRFFKPELDHLGIRINEVLDLLREQDRTPNNPVFCETEQVYSRLSELSDIRGGYAVLEQTEISVREGTIRFGDKKIIPGRKVCSYMQHVESIAVFLCSAGEGFTEWSRTCTRESDYLKGYIIDTFGSLAAEKMADYIQTQLQAEIAEKGLKITNRYSPGYCNWRLAEQKYLFELLPVNNPCRISLTESMLMMPIKSISGIIGIGKNVKKLEYACDVCKDKNCVYREVKLKTALATSHN